MSKKILVIDGHPNPNSFCAGLSNTYAEAAEKAGHSVKRLTLRDLDFDPILHKGYNEIQELEPDLISAQALIAWSEHLVWVYPVWWGTFPALMKGFLDRAFLPGFAFKYHEKDPWWDRLLAGRSARIITTMDAPGLYHRYIHRRPAFNAMKHATMRFSGVKPVKATVFGGVKGADEAKRKKWLEKVARLGAKGK